MTAAGAGPESTTQLLRRATLQTVADAVGVSKMTVSNAYSRPDQLSATLRERILATARSLGYPGPDLTARALNRGVTGAIGVVLSGSLRWAFTDVVTAELLGAVAAELEQTGQALTLLGGSRAADDATARNVAVDGALILSASAPAVGPLIDRRIPRVYVDEAAPPECSSVTIDDAGSARQASQYLVDLGHRRIALLTPAFPGRPRLVEAVDELPAATSFVGAERLRGWLEPLRAHGIEPLLAVAGYAEPDTGRADYDTVRELLTRPDRPTAVLCFSDVLAGLVHCVAHDLGLTVPADLSMIGFDDAPSASTLRPALTTIRQDVSAKGGTAARELRRVLEAERAGTTADPQHLVIDTELVVRGSTAPPPA